MKTADYPVWLAVMPDQRDTAHADAGKHPDGRSAIMWDKEAQLWYARPGADLSRLKAWLPDSTIRSSGGGDPQSEFLDALTSAGLELDGLPVMDGRRHRVPVAEGKRGNRDGVYRGFLDGIKPAGWYINYHRADNEKDITRWKASGSFGEADPVARVHIRAVMRQSKDDFAREQAALYARQTARANALYGRLPPADPKHSYLTNKGITAAEDVRQTNNGALVVPFYDVKNTFQTLQYISPDGEKYLFKDAPKAGHFRVEGGELHNGEPIFYAEGYATARSLHMVTGRPVVMTIDAGNMQTVAEVLKTRYPDSPHLFMADVDHAKKENKGVLSAKRAAASTGGTVLLPDLTATELERGFTDFNDLHVFRGAEHLRETLLPDINRALEGLNYKETSMAKSDDPKSATTKVPSASPDAAPLRRPGSAKEKTGEILSLHEQGVKAAQIAAQLGIGQTSVYRILRAQQAESTATEQAETAVTVSEPIKPAIIREPVEAPAVEQAVTVQTPEKVVAAPTATAAPQSDISPEPKVFATSSAAPADPENSFVGLYGTGAELRVRLAALASGQITPAVLLEDIKKLSARVDTAAVAGIYTREHVNEMRAIFKRVTQGGIAGADVTKKGTFNRLRGLLGQRDTWNSLHPNGGLLDVNTIPDRIAQQYVMLARGDVTRADFDREVRMLYGEFTRADPGSFTSGRHDETRAVFERMESLKSPEDAAQYVAVSGPQLPPLSSGDPNADKLYRIQNALRDEFISMAHGDTSVSAVAENVAQLQTQLDKAKEQGVYSKRHLNEVQNAFDRVTKGGLAGMPSPDALASRGNFESHHLLAGTLDVATVPDRIDAQYEMLVRGEVTRAQFEGNLAMLRAEVVAISESGKANPAAVSASEVAFANVNTLSTLSASGVSAQASEQLKSIDAPPPQPTASMIKVAVANSQETPQTERLSTSVTATTSLGNTPEDVRNQSTARATASTLDSGQLKSADALPLQSSTAPIEVPATDSRKELRTAPVSVAAAVTTSGDSPQALSTDSPSESATRAAESTVDDMPQVSTQNVSKPDISSDSPLASAFGEENGILVGAPRVAPLDENASTASGMSRIDADKLIGRITHEKQPDGQSVLYRLDGEPAFIDHGNRLAMAKGASSNEEKVLAALLTAANHYHGRIELTGSDEFKAFAINVIVANKLDVSMKNASQQADLDAALRAAGQPVSPEDAVRGDPQAPRYIDTPPVTPVAQSAHEDVLQQNTSSVTPSQKQVFVTPVAPEAPRISPAVHTPAEKAREPITGKVTACGQAPFRFEPGKSESTYITMRTKEGQQTFWGKELAGLLRETNLKTGRMVTLQWMGEQPVTIKVPQKNDEGVVTHYTNVDTHRNQWSLTPVGGTRVKTGAEDMVPLAAVDTNRYAQIQHALVSRLGLAVDAPPKPIDGLYWVKPDGQGSSQPGDPLSAPRPAYSEHAGTPVMSAWGDDGKPDLHLVQGDGNYLQGVVRQNGIYQHVLVSLPDNPEAPPMVVNLLTPEGAKPIGSGNGINRSNGQPVAREHVVVRLTGDSQPRVAKLDYPAEMSPTLHAKLGYDERFKAESGWVKDQPAAAPQVAPATPPRPAQ